jgi:SprT-like protein
MQQKDLQELVETVSNESFNKPFRHQATFNSRLRTTGGRYLLRTHNLEFNPKQLELFGLDEFIKIVKHELCHYHLHIVGRGYKHQDLEFKALLKQVGGSRYCQSIPGNRRQSKWMYLYTCNSCRQLYPRKRQMDVRRYRCGKCGGRLKLQSKQRIEDPGH